MADQDENKQQDGQQADTGKQDGHDAGTGTQDPPKSDGKTFTEADVERIVKDRLDRERKSAETKAAKEKADADAARLKEQGEFEKLANQRAATITELEAKVAEGEAHKTRADRYETALKAHLDTQRKDLPAHITALLDRMDPVDQLEYIAANRDALGAKPGQNGSGIPATPKPGDRKALTEEQQQAAQRQAAQLVKSRF